MPLGPAGGSRARRALTRGARDRGPAAAWTLILTWQTATGRAELVTETMVVRWDHVGSVGRPSSVFICLKPVLKLSMKVKCSDGTANVVEINFNA